MRSTSIREAAFLSLALTAACSSTSAPPLPQNELQALLTAGQRARLWVTEFKQAVKTARASSTPAYKDWLQKALVHESKVRDAYINRVVAPHNGALDALQPTIEANSGYDQARDAILQQSVRVSEGADAVQKEAETALGAFPEASRGIDLPGNIVALITGLTDSCIHLFAEREKVAQALRDRMKADLTKLRLPGYVDT